MAFFGGLCFFFLLSFLVSRLFPALSPGSYAAMAAVAAAVMFILVGVSHFAKPEKLEKMLEGLTEHKRAVNYLSGAVEIVLGIGLLFPATRWYAAIGLCLLMVVVFPANVNVARHHASFYNVSRLFFQPVYILWLLWAGGILR